MIVKPLLVQQQLSTTLTEVTSYVAPSMAEPIEHTQAGLALDKPSEYLSSTSVTLVKTNVSMVQKAYDAKTDSLLGAAVIGLKAPAQSKVLVETASPMTITKTTRNPAPTDATHRDPTISPDPSLPEPKTSDLINTDLPDTYTYPVAKLFRSA